MTTPGATISAAFPYSSRTVEVLGSKMHFVAEGDGDPILFLHGNPTSSYLWRNIIPRLTSRRRCVAPDLIGMGRSDKPDIGYRFFDHAAYVEGFIEAMELTNITLVLHDWGSALGFHYAMRHPENVKGIVFMEAILKPIRWSDFPEAFRTGFRLMRTPVIGWFLISVLNIFVERILPRAVVRTLSDEELRRYAEPFRTIRSRKPVRVWPCEIPIDGRPADVHEAVSDYSRKLRQSDIPKLLLHASPGGIIGPGEVDWCQRRMRNLTTSSIGPGIHYVQEDNPAGIASAIRTWLERR